MRGALSHVCRAFRQHAQEAVPCSRRGLQHPQLEATLSALWLLSERGNVPISRQTDVFWQGPFTVSSGRSAVSFAAAQAQPEVSQPEVPHEDLVITDSAVERLQQLASRSDAVEAALRISVDSGGCSGFQYKFDLDNQIGPSDRVFEQSGVKIVADSVSMEFLRGAVIDFTTDLIRSGFEVVQNPNSKGGCGCGASFEPR